ncbi:hypothetical protein [Citrobacter sp. T1.2D-1]|nr:hypothetical protein [Citrobacter sp. T1.2D-1]CAI9397811.1 hypothetical protein CITSP_02463 [Citrobacter sp. T1.2D-1]
MFFTHSSTSSIGYWFTGADEHQNLIVGNKIKNAHRGPPWMVVDQTISSVIVTARHWPGRLWRVRVIRMGDMSGLVANPGYWRASKIELIEALSCGVLFGMAGEAIVTLLQDIKCIDTERAALLQTNLPADAQQLWQLAWKNWNRRLPSPRTEYDDENEELTLGWPGRDDKEVSPVGRGFMLVQELFRQHVRETQGSAAFIRVEEDGETEEYLTPLWSAAIRALLFRMMALAEREYLSPSEFAQLSQSWNAVFVGKPCIRDRPGGLR